MIFGVLKDIKEGENRVICTPVEIASIVAAGHTALVQKGAGAGAGFPDPLPDTRISAQQFCLAVPQQRLWYR